MKRSFSPSFLVNTLPIIVVLIVFAVIFDWGNAVKVFFRETKVGTQKKYVDDIVYDIKIDRIEEASTNGKVDDEFILINSSSGNAFYIRYVYDESKKKTNLEEYKNYTVNRCTINLDTTRELTDIINGKTSYMETNANIAKSTGDYYVYVNDKVKRVLSKNDTDAMKIIEKIQADSKPVANM